MYCFYFVVLTFVTIISFPYNFKKNIVHLPQPVPLGNCRVAAYSIVLVRYPHDQYDVERSCSIVEELRHYSLHACEQ